MDEIEPTIHLSTGFGFCKWHDIKGKHRLAIFGVRDGFKMVIEYRDEDIEKIISGLTYR